MDELNNQYDKVKSAEQAIRQGKTRLDPAANAEHTSQRVTWNYDPAKYRISKEEAAALTGSVDRFIKEFSAKTKPQTSAMEQAQAQMDAAPQVQPALQQETEAAFDALLQQAKAETVKAQQQSHLAQGQTVYADTQPQSAHHPAAPISPVSTETQRTQGGTHHGVVQSEQAPVKEGELSGLMDEYMRVMNDEDDEERGGRFRRRRKERKREKARAQQNLPLTPPRAPVPQAPVVPFEAPQPEPELPQNFLAPEDAFEIPEEVVAPIEEDVFDIPEEVVAPMEEDAFDIPEEVVAPVEEDAFDIPEKVVAPMEEDAFDIPEEVVAPVEEDAFDIPEEVVAPVEEATFDIPEGVVAPVEEDAFDIPEEVVAPVEADAFDIPEEVVAPAEEDAFDAPEAVAEPEEEVIEPAEMFDETTEEAVEIEDAFEFPEEFLMPEIEEIVPVEEFTEEPTESADALLPPEDVFQEEPQAVEADAAPQEDAVVDPDKLFSDLPQDAAAEEPYAPQMVDLSDLAEDDEVFSQEPTYPTQFEDVTSYSAQIDPDDRFVPAEETPEAEPAAEEAAVPELTETPDETPDAPQESAEEATAAPVKKRKEHRFLRGIGKFFCTILLIVSLLATAVVALIGTVLDINSGEPVVGNYYLFTAANSYEGTAVDEGDLVLCQKTSAIPNDTGVVYVVEGQTKSFSFGVKRSEYIDATRNNLMIYDVSGVTVTETHLLGTVMQTLPHIGTYARYIIDRFIPLISGCGALDVLFILLLILLSHRKREYEDEPLEETETPELPQAPEQDDLFGDIG